MNASQSAFDVVVLGSGGPRAAGRAASSYLLLLDGAPRVLVDAGPGAFVRLGETGLPQQRLDTILLTHLHVDHAGDLAALIKSRDLLGQEALSFRVFGPEGRAAYPSTEAFVDRLFGEQGAFAYLPAFRNPLTITPTNVPTDTEAAPRRLLEEEGLTVTAVAVDHGDTPAVAYRVAHGARSVVITGDLASRDTRIRELAMDADLLIYDAAVRDPPAAPQPLYALHTPPRRIGEVAKAARVKSLLLTHIPPDVEAHAREVLESVAASFQGPARLASDCMHIPLGP